MNKRKVKPKPEWQNKIARERIKKLFDEAKEAFEKHPDRSHRYVEMARKLSMRYNITIPRELKRKFCKHCYKFLVSGKNAQTRTRSAQQAVIVKCLECGKIMRFPYRKEKKMRKKDKQVI